MEKVAFFDRDGVVNVDKNYVYKIEDFRFQDGIFEILSYLKNKGYLLILVTNQSGIGRGYYTLKDFEILSKYMQDTLRETIGFGFDKIYFCPHDPDEKCSCRKPGIAMIQKACEEYDISLKDSVFIGDKPSDMECASNAKIKTKILLNTENISQDGIHKITNLKEIKNLI